MTSVGNWNFALAWNALESGTENPNVFASRVIVSNAKATASASSICAHEAPAASTSRMSSAVTGREAGIASMELGDRVRSVLVDDSVELICAARKRWQLDRRRQDQQGAPIDIWHRTSMRPRHGAAVMLV